MNEADKKYLASKLVTVDNDIYGKFDPPPPEELKPKSKKTGVEAEMEKEMNKRWKEMFEGQQYAYSKIHPINLIHLKRGFPEYWAFVGVHRIMIANNITHEHTMSQEEFCKKMRDSKPIGMPEMRISPEYR